MPKRKSNEAAALHRWSVSMATEYWNILKDMFDHFMGGCIGPEEWPSGGATMEGRETPFNLLQMRCWARRWAKTLEVTPEQVGMYLEKYGHCEYIKPVLFLLSDKEAGENE